MSPKTCGGCRGEGAHSPRCMTQPGGLWRRLAGEAKSLADSIGSNDPEAANVAYSLQGLFQQRWNDAVAAQIIRDDEAEIAARASDPPPPPWLSALWNDSPR